MMLLDTTVVSEAIRMNARADVLDWMRRQRLEHLHLAAPSLAELLVGIAAMPVGSKRSLLAKGLDVFVRAHVRDRVLSFDRRAAGAYANLIVNAHRRGRAISVVDGQIAAIANVHDLAVATRDVGPFEAVGLTVINPWDQGVPDIRAEE